MKNRTREDLEAYFTAGVFAMKDRFIIELLLDIRDILKNLPQPNSLKEDGI